MIAALFCICLLATANASYITKEKIASGTTVDYPVRLTYIDKFNSWWPQPAILAGLGVPGYTNGALPYNYVALAFWTASGGPVDAALVWSNPLYFIGAGYVGDTIQEIQANLKKNFTNAGVKLIVSAFGATENPTSENLDPVQVGTDLAAFVNDNLFDGVDIDWEDTPAFQSGDGKGENWLIALTQTLRAKLNPGLIITHAPQGPYFAGAAVYPMGGYLAVHQAVGDIIDFYNIQFYNQGSTMYNNGSDIFNVSGGWAPKTSVNEMIAAGVQATKIVIGKPASTGDASNSYMLPSDINAAIAANYPYNGWKTGIMFWQYSSDLDGSICKTAAAFLLSVHQK